MNSESRIHPGMSLRKLPNKNSKGPPRGPQGSPRSVDFTGVFLSLDSEDNFPKRSSI